MASAAPGQRMPTDPAGRHHPSEPAGWRQTQRRLHWLSAALVVCNAALAYWMVALPLTDLLAKFLAYQLHKSVGLLILLLLIWRLALRAWSGRPAPAAIPGWQRRAASAVQVLLYVLLGAVPVAGYLTAAAAPGSVPTTFFLLMVVPRVFGPDAALYAWLRPLHLALALALLGLALGHAAAAVLHHRKGRDVLMLMWRGR